MKVRTWMVEYGVAVVLTVLFSIVLGHIPLFQGTSVGKLRASDLVQFLGYGGALAIAWSGARQLANDPPEDWKWLTPFRPLVLPLTALMTAAVSYSVLLLVAGPFLGKTGKGIYNWMFIVGMVTSAAWLISTWIRKCAPLVGSMAGRKLKKAA